jgi:hypothetical protein
VEHPKAAVPKDRDERAVLAALRGLDPCELLRTAARATPGYPRNVRLTATRPTSCVVGGDPAADVPTVAVQVDELATDKRVTLASATLGGAKGHLEQRAVCDVYLPVSFRLALRFTVDGPADPCERGTPLVEAAARVLAGPRAARTTPRWDACLLLGVATGGTATEEKGGLVTDGCRTTDAAMEVELGYATTASGTPDRIGSTDVRLRPGTPCEVTWAAGPPAERSPDALAATVRAPSCPAAKQLAGAAITALAKPPTTDVSPQWPLLYGPDESDTPLPGACGFAVPGYENGEYEETCEPYVEVPVPSGRAEILRAAAADLNVTCALAANAVADEFGEQLAPVTMTGKATRECLFVEPPHRYQLAVELSPGPLRGDGRRVDVAGHRAVADCESESVTCRITVAASTNPDDAGTLDLEIRKRPGAEFVDETLSPDIQDKAERVLAGVLRTHFG